MARGSKIAIPPAKPDLSRYLDFDEEAAKFELTTERVAEIAGDVERSSPSTFITVTKIQCESDLRERLQAVYNEQLEQFRSCNWNGCNHQFADVHDFVAHHRMHLICDCPDHKVRRLVLKDIEERLVPMVASSMTAEGVLPAEERLRIAEALDRRRLVATSFDQRHRDPHGEDEQDDDGRAG